MLVSAAVCPHPPALVPAVSQGAAADLADLRDACVRSVRDLLAVEHDLLVCVGAGPVTTSWGSEAGGSLRRYGVAAAFGGAELFLPLSLTVGAYLLEQAGAANAGLFQSVAVDASADRCQAIGAGLAGACPRVAMLVMGDGSAKRTRHSPGYVDTRAEAFDAEVVLALAQPDPVALCGLDPALAEELWVAGRPAWQVLAGALTSSGRPLTGSVRYEGAPLGVGYAVVLLEPG